MIELILFALGTASLSHFFQVCMDEGMIFESYHKWLQTLPNWLKAPLGNCIFCNGTWIFILLYFLKSLSVFPYNSFILAVFCLVGIGLNYVFIELIYKLK